MWSPPCWPFTFTDPGTRRGFLLRSERSPVPRAVRYSVRRVVWDRPSKRERLRTRSHPSDPTPIALRRNRSPDASGAHVTRCSTRPRRDRCLCLLSSAGSLGRWHANGTITAYCSSPLVRVSRLTASIIGGSSAMSLYPPVSLDPSERGDSGRRTGIGERSDPQARSGSRDGEACGAFRRDRAPRSSQRYRPVSSDGPF